MKWKLLAGVMALVVGALVLNSGFGIAADDTKKDDPKKDDTKKDDTKKDDTKKDDNPGPKTVEDVKAALKTANVKGRIVAVSEDGKLVTIQPKKKKTDTEDPPKTDVKLTDKTAKEFFGFEKDEDKKIAVGNAAAVWLDEKDKDTATKILVMFAKKKKKEAAN